MDEWILLHVAKRICKVNCDNDYYHAIAYLHKHLRILLAFWSYFEDKGIGEVSKYNGYLANLEASDMDTPIVTRDHVIARVFLGIKNDEKSFLVGG